MTKQKAENNVARTNILTKILIAIGLAGILVPSWHEWLHHVNAPAPYNYIFAAGLVGIFLCLILEPAFRK